MNFVLTAVDDQPGNRVNYSLVYRVSIIALALAISLSITPDTANSEVATSREQQFTKAADAGSRAPVGLEEPAPYRLDRGDKLRVRFYERYDREDLNGDYVVGESGQLRLPRIGMFDVRRKTTQEVETGIREVVEKKGEKLGYFSVDVVECRPFYVGGLVNRPGAYPFVNGLTVLHAVSLAGGLYRFPLSSSVEALRERSKLAEAIDRLKAPLARRARLFSERDKLETIVAPPDLVQLDPLNVKEIIERERVIMQRVREVDNREKAGLEKIVTLTKSEGDTYAAEIQAIAERLDEQTRLFANLKKLHDQKLINQQRYFESLASLDTVQRDKQLAIASLARARSSLEKAQRDLAMLELLRESRIAKEIAETELELTRLQVSVDEARKLTRNLEGLAGQGGSETYRIMRRDEAGRLQNQRVTETTPILPGDVVQIEALQDGKLLNVN